MSTPTQQTGISPAVLADLRAAADHAAGRVRDPEAMRQACERMDRMRAELRQERGELNIAVELIRQARDEQ